MSIYRAGDGAIMLPSWPESRTIAICDWRLATRRVEIAWMSGAAALEYLGAVVDMLIDGADMMLLTNRKREVCGFVTPEPAELRAIPVAIPYAQELTEKRRSFTMSDWRLGKDALIQATSIDEHGETVCVDDVSGETAWQRLMQLACDPTAGLIGDPDAVYGLAWPDGSREEMWDCDEMTFSSYLQCLAEVIQDAEAREDGD